ncbi:hypothetical protein AM363_08095 [Citrobacter freundii]|uniref:Uncharacterized protein n=1 Tax=Citrobacter freundii TaxID=546 RepID=A0AB33H114_CITFR|nr:hypothetical protein [Citrobacter freundii]AXZ46916.1 hypothetical protein AM363_08095 [Citrobacter freundii]
MNKNVQALVENTVKDILLGNAALTFLFAVPLAYIVKNGLDIGIWLLTLFIAPALCGVGTWIVSRIEYHAKSFFHSRWARRGYVVYVLVSAELLVIYSITQLTRTLIK